ncbi:MAG: hypothetical protein VR68_10320 [Peptococcaceae bacterium BRH_c4a]|nr:MAG: hypothetical protein VR68_10320 [Peptococcaceae bacterium BRH_c4a]
MRSFIKGILAGTLLGALAGSFMKPGRKMELNDLMHMTEDSRMGRRTGKIVKGVAKSLDKMMRSDKL